MKVVVWFSFFSLIFSYVFGSEVFADNVPAVVINEVAWAGSFKSSADEWIELHNTTTESQDISSWQITKNTGTESLMITIPPDSSIEPGGYFIISNFGSVNSVLAIEPNLVDESITLSNSALQIKLYSGDFNNGSNLIDTAGDGGVPLAGKNTTKSTMERTHDFSGWQDSSAQINLDEGSQELATPGDNNSTISQPPTIASITPGTVEKGEDFVVDGIVGSGFMEGLILQIKNDGQIISASNVHVASPELIDGGIFNTDAATAGGWDVVIINPDGLQAILPTAVNITEPEQGYDMATTIRVNEVYPSPHTGQEEFIELFNYGDKAINLLGWKIDDIPNGGSSAYTLPSITVLPNKFLVIPKSQSHITLNDNGDNVSLIQPDGFELDKSIFSESTKGSSWSWFNNEYKWTTTVTANGINVLTVPQEAVDQDQPDEEQDDTATPAKSFHPKDVIITELLPNPDSDQEFIELQNNTNQTIDLKNWYIKDASGKKYLSGKSLLIKPQQFLVIYSEVSHIALNNSGGEEIRLYDPADHVISSAMYPDKAPVDIAYAYDGNDWLWTLEATPGLVNQIEVNEIEELESDEVLADTLDETLPVTGHRPRDLVSGFLVLFGALGILSWQRYAIHGNQKK